MFLVVDGWATLRGEYDDLEPMITDIATRGLSYGVHVVAAATRWMDFRPAIRDLFGSRLELRLGDPTDSMVYRRGGGRTCRRSPAGLAGIDRARACTSSPCCPDSPASVATPRRWSRRSPAGWTGAPAPRVRLLPPVLPYAELDLARTTGLRLPIGIAEADLRPVSIDFASEPHFLLFGDAECGKSSFLRALATSITAPVHPGARPG